MTEQFIRVRIAAMPRAKRLELFMAGVGADEESNVDVLLEALRMPEPGEYADAENTGG